MKVINYLMRLYLKSSLHVALSVTALVYITLIHKELNLDKYLMSFVFFGTIIAYNFIKYGLEVRRYVLRNKRVMIPVIGISFISSLFVLHSLMHIDHSKWIILALLTVLIFLYAVPLLPTGINLRNLSRLKIYVVALVWSGLTVLLPTYTSIENVDWILFLNRFVLTIVLMIPFEIRDLKYDEAQLKTLPQLLGVRPVKQLGYGLTLLWLFLEGYFKVSSWVIAFIVGCVLLMSLYYTNEGNKRFFTEFWVESIPIVYAIFVGISHL